ncbi:MAG: flagellar biosynthesis protein FlhB [bacterium]
MDIDLQLFASPEDEGRTEEPTHRRLERARRRGQVARTAELSPTIITLATAILLLFIGLWIFSSLLQFLYSSIAKINSDNLNPERLYLLFIGMGVDFLKITIPIMACAFFVSIFSEVLQTGLYFSYSALSFDLSKIGINLGRIWQRIVPSAKTLIEYAKAIFKICVISYFAWKTISSHYTDIIFTMSGEITESFFLITRLSYDIMIKSAIFLAIMAVLDYLYQKHEYKRQLKMTRYELKDEIKQMEGDPLVRARIRERQRQMAARRMMEEVKKADVVITNPTHLAIAIRYDASSMSAPMVVAKGESFIAEKIVAIAKEHNVPIVENKPLAEALYRAVQIGAEVGAEFYQAVAEVLAFVWKLKKK